MESNLLLAIANFLQSCVPLLSLVAYIPQWKKIITTQSSKDISLVSWLIWVIATSFTLFYASIQYYAFGHGLALIFSTALSLLFIAVTIYLMIIYRNIKEPNT